MSKITELKEKVIALRSQLQEKVDNIAFLKKWKEKRAEKVQQGPNPYSLSEIYKKGGVGTRLQVILVYIFAISTLVSTGFVARKMMSKFKSSKEHEQLVKDYSQELQALNQKVQDSASVISLGQMTVNAYVGEGRTALMGLDLWIKVTNAESADFAQKNEEKLQEKAMDALNSLNVDGVNLLTEDGKEKARARIRDSLNTAFKTGKVEDVYFHNLLVQ